MFKLGPLVSFNGSPTVSPITAALWQSLFFFCSTPSSSLNYPLSIYFLALSQAPPELALEVAIVTPETYQFKTQKKLLKSLVKVRQQLKDQRIIRKRMEYQ